jgi:hypothetical protein
MALEISPIETFNQIKNLNQMLQRRANLVQQPEKKKIFTHDEEIDLRAYILENISSTELTKLSSMIDTCKKNGYDEESILKTIKKMIGEHIIDSLENKFLLRVDDSD